MGQGRHTLRSISDPVYPPPPPPLPPPQVQSVREYARMRTGAQELHTTENTALQALAATLTLV